MEQMQQMRPRPRIPAVQCGTGATSRRLDRHLAILGAPALPQVDTADAVGLIRELTPRGMDAAVTASATGARPHKRTRVSLFAPLRRLRRSLFGGRG